MEKPSRSNVRLVSPTASYFLLRSHPRYSRLVEFGDGSVVAADGKCKAVYGG
jgi:hypothetical protein